MNYAATRSNYRTVVRETIGEEASVRGLSQVSVAEYDEPEKKTMNEEELQNALKVQCDLGDVFMFIQMGKA